MFDNEFASSSAILPGDEFLILQSHGRRALVAGYLFEPKLHENGFKDADPPRLSVLDNVDLIRERLVDEFDSSFDCAFILAFRIAALALLPLRIFRRPLVADMLIGFADIFLSWLVRRDKIFIILSKHAFVFCLSQKDLRIRTSRWCGVSVVIISTPRSDYHSWNEHFDSSIRPAECDLREYPDRFDHVIHAVACQVSP